MKSLFRKSFIVAAFLFGSASISNAQVKIGANPATIDANSALEVEAANGNKTTINKTTGQVTIKDGTQGVDRILTSDANGNTSWKEGAANLKVNGNVPATWPAVPKSASLSFYYSGGRITLPAGNWLIYFNATYKNTSSTNLQMFWDISTSSTTNTTLRRVLGGSAPSDAFSTVSAVYDVNPTASTTYYFWGSAVGSAPGNAVYSGEGRIYAVQVTN